ncbi:MAG: molybdopterin oxidoreductase, partial [Ignavibacteria bacterium]|nr:molybdopterin oxidoreductase [Ignavibacteria bacterium]
MNQNNNQSEHLRNNEEFMPGVTDEFNLKEMSGLSRRKFLALAGASAAFAATACTNYRDKGEVMPYVKKPEEVTVGKSNFYASTCTECPLSCGTLVKTREGRPVKIMGNPENPVNKGKICSTGEASILNLYDPDRMKFPLNQKGSELFLFKDDVNKETWANSDNEIVSALNKAKAEGKEIAFLSYKISSPSFYRLIEDFKVKYPSAKFYSYELFDESNRISALKKSYNCDTVPVINWAEAKTILALEADILGTEGSFMEQIRVFADKRNPDDIKEFCRLYSAEGTLSLTGINADYRFGLRPEAQFDLVMAILNEILYKKQSASFQPSSTIEKEIREYSLEKVAEEYKLNLKNLKLLVNDLVKSKGKSVVYAGSKLDESTHIAVNLLNEVLGNGKIVNSECAVDFAPLSTNEEIRTLIGNLNSGKVAVLVHLGTNPV